MEIILRGTFEECQRDALRLFGQTVPVIETVIENALNAGTVGAHVETVIENALNADTVEALNTPVNAPESAQDAPAPAVEETPAEPEQTAESAPETPAITLVEARARMNELRQAHGAPAVKAVLKKIGYPKFTDVPPEKYPELMVLCDAAEKGFAANA